LGAYYICRQCGYAFPKQDKQEVIDLDYEDNTYGLDVHCPQCGATINQFTKVTSAKVSQRLNGKSLQKNSSKMKDSGRQCRVRGSGPPLKRIT
jgi:rubredoxin